MLENLEGQEHLEKIEEEGKSKNTGLKRAGGIIGNIFCFVVIALLAILVFYLFQSRIEGEKPTIIGHEMYIVESGSMLPSIEIGSLIVTRKVEPEELLVGDVITYGGGQEQKTVTHRIVDIVEEEELSFITRGDANAANDPLPVKSQAVIGKVVLDIPYVGYLMHFLRTKNGFFLLIIFPAGLIILSQLFKVYKLLDKTK